MQQKKSEGTIFGCAVEESTMPVYRRVLDLREAGKGLTDIARQLNAEGVPTARGAAQWYPATIRRIVTSETAKRMRARA